MTYKKTIIEVLKRLGGHAYLSDIYDAFKEMNKDKILPSSYKAIIRSQLERNSSDSNSFDGKDNLFYSVDGIGNGHWGLIKYDDDVELTQEDDEFSEGKLRLKEHLRRERNPKLISEAKKSFINKNGHLFCEICGFDFKKTYGDLGENFIEAHHSKPISTMKDGEKTRIEDIVMVCSNCHSMLHRKKPWIDKEYLKSVLVNNNSNSLTEK